MSDIFADNPIPKGAIVGAAALVLLTVAAAGTARWTGVGTLQVAPVAIASTTELVFRDRPDGAIEVTGGAMRVVLEPGTNGFIRGMLRGLARDRKVAGIGAEAPFHLVRRVDGRLVLVDPATNRTLDLGAYGSANAGAFGSLLQL